MAEDDIYGSKGKYERFKADLNSFGIPPEQRPSKKKGTAKYYCRNVRNLEYFRGLFAHFEARDQSYIRRHRLIQSLRLICYLTEKDLQQCTRDDINEIVASMHSIYNTTRSKQTFIHDIKYFWKVLFPEPDRQGRPDETLVPYVVRHLSASIDRSRQKMRTDKLSWDEFERLVNYFGRDPRMQAYLALALESLARPQELLYLKIGDVEAHDSFAKVYISEHGKEGIGLLQCIDSYPYVLKWIDCHPLKKDKKAFLFINLGNHNRLSQLRPPAVNRMLRTACHDLQIDKPITCYSLKRSGVTLRRLRGDSDMEIQHAARWTSTKQLKTYDLTHQDEAFKLELEKRGLIASTDGEVQTPKICAFCKNVAGFGEVICGQCKRPLDRTVIMQEAKEQTRELGALKEELASMTNQLRSMQQLVIPELAREIRAAKKAGQEPEVLNCYRAH